MSNVLRTPKSEEDWTRLARQILRMHMTMLDWRFADLSRALARIGVDEDEVLLRNRIGLGRFRATLFLQCLVAMGVEQLTLPAAADPKDAPPPPPPPLPVPAARTDRGQSAGDVDGKGMRAAGKRRPPAK